MKLDNSLVFPFCWGHDSDLAVHYLFDGVVDFRHAEPLFVGDGLRAWQAGHLYLFYDAVTVTSAGYWYPRSKS
jgi:hypothetical protein